MASSRHPSTKLSRNAELMAYVRSGASTRQAAAKFNLRQQTVHEIITREDPDLLPARKRAVHEAARERLYAQFVERAATATPCKVCGWWSFDRKDRTCGDAECVWAWRFLREKKDPRRRRQHRLATARRAIKDPDRHPDWVVKWAKAFLADPDGHPPAYTYYRPGSVTRRVARAAGLLVEDEPPYLYP